MYKKINNYEIDLLEIIFKIINNKFKIILITLITVVSSLAIYLNENKSELKVTLLAETEIVSNSIFDDYEYQALNDFIVNLKKQNLSSFGNEEEEQEETNEIIIVSDNFKNFNLLSNFSFDPIDSTYLYNLFVEKLNQKDFLLKAITKSDLIDKKRFNNNYDYEKAVIELASNINIIYEKENEKNSVKIKFEVSNKNKWEQFLYYVEISANNEIQNYLKKKFNMLTLNINRVSNYLLEDIDFEILSNKDNEIALYKLNGIKRRIKANKNVERLTSLYKETPIFDANNFSAARVKYESTKYQDTTNYPAPVKKVILISILLGVLLGIIYVLITGNSKKR